MRWNAQVAMSGFPYQVKQVLAAVKKLEGQE